MDFQKRSALSWALLLFTVLPALVAGIAVDICSGFNTATMPANNSIYQTNGLCHDFCINDYAYAITQDNSCWCSNYAPATVDTVSVSKCNQQCPAWPQEFCGGPGVFSYIILDNIPASGTKTAPSPTPTPKPSSSSSSSSSSGDSTTAAATSMTETVQSTTIFSSPETSATSFSSSSSSSSSSVSSVRQMTTIAGTVKTIYIDPTGTPGTSSGDTGDTHTKSSGLGTGPVVGIVVGVIGAVLVIAGGLLFWFFRRKREQRQVEGYQDDPSFRGSSGSNGPEMAGSGGAPASPNSAGNRSSMLQIDPRMDPFKQGLYARNGSHESINTLHDDHDYSRRIQQPKVLRATNPDPDNDG